MNYYKTDDGSVLMTTRDMDLLKIEKEEFERELKKVNTELDRRTQEFLTSYEKTHSFDDSEVLHLFTARNINTLLLDNNTALRCIEYHPEWRNLCEEQYKTESKGFRFQYEGKLYETVQPSHTFQSQWIPGAEGTSSIYSQVNWIHDGTLEDPIPVPDNVNTVAFTYIVGKYYDEDGTIWKCQREGEEDGTEHSFTYKPSEAIGYFVKVE